MKPSRDVSISNRYTFIKHFTYRYTLYISKTILPIKLPIKSSIIPCAQPWTTRHRVKSTVKWDVAQIALSAPHQSARRRTRLTAVGTHAIKYTCRLRALETRMMHEFRRRRVRGAKHRSMLGALWPNDLTIWCKLYGRDQNSRSLHGAAARRHLPNKYAKLCEPSSSLVYEALCAVLVVVATDERLAS